jgi:hypothetical protein
LWTLSERQYGESERRNWNYKAIHHVLRILTAIMLQTSRAAFSLDSSSTFSSPVSKQPARFDLRAGLDAKRGLRAEDWRFALDQAQGRY